MTFNIAPVASFAPLLTHAPSLSMFCLFLLVRFSKYKLMRFVHCVYQIYHPVIFALCINASPYRRLFHFKKEEEKKKPKMIGSHAGGVLADWFDICLLQPPVFMLPASPCAGMWAEPSQAEPGLAKHGRGNSDMLRWLSCRVHTEYHIGEDLCLL